MKRKGFIATSLIYSFFLVFCTVLISYIGISTHNKNLIQKEDSLIRNDLNNKRLSSASIGSFVNINIYNDVVNINGVRWLVYRIDNSNNKAYLVSDAPVLSYDTAAESYNISNTIAKVNSALAGFSSYCFSERIRSMNRTDLTYINSVTDSEVKSRLADIANDYLIIDGSSSYRYVYSSNVFQSYNNANSVINVRGIVVLPAVMPISGGDGTIINPYILPVDTCE